jgi:hypothetical protein
MLLVLIAAVTAVQGEDFVVTGMVRAMQLARGETKKLLRTEVGDYKEYSESSEAQIAIHSSI